VVENAPAFDTTGKHPQNHLRTPAGLPDQYCPNVFLKYKTTTYFSNGINLKISHDLHVLALIYQISQKQQLLALLIAPRIAPNRMTPGEFPKRAW
jgi:hypothetical protein